MVMLQTTVPAYKTLGADCADEVGKWRASFLSFFFFGSMFRSCSLLQNNAQNERVAGVVQTIGDFFLLVTCWST